VAYVTIRILEINILSLVRQISYLIVTSGVIVHQALSEPTPQRLRNTPVLTCPLGQVQGKSALESG
jgi:hypothetical protein